MIDGEHEPCSIQSTTIKYTDNEREHMLHRTQQHTRTEEHKAQKLEIKEMPASAPLPLDAQSAPLSKQIFVFFYLFV